jgi:hypothetical protein
MLIVVDTFRGPRLVRVCDYCRAACIPSGRFCSGAHARAFEEAGWKRPEDERLPDHARRSVHGQADSRRSTNP